MSYIDKAAPTLYPKVARALNVNAEVVRAEMYGLLERNRVGRGRTYTTFFRTAKSGKLFPVGERKAPHQASAPGDAPARDTGRLMESIAVTKRATPASLVAETGPRVGAFKGAFYPAFLEYGTRKIKPRPFVRPTAGRVRAIFAGTGVKVA